MKTNLRFKALLGPTVFNIYRLVLTNKNFRIILYYAYGSRKNVKKPNKYPLRSWIRHNISVRNQVAGGCPFPVFYQGISGSVFW